MPFIAAFLKHTYARFALAALAAIALGSGAYYFSATRPPPPSPLSPAPESTTITASGDIETAVDPDLSFASSGRVASVAATVGEHVAAGALLASLDTGELSASLAGARAAEDAEKAAFTRLKAGARPEDVAVLQAADDRAAQDLLNLYTDVSDTETDAFAKADDAVHRELSDFFAQGDSGFPHLLFSSYDAQAGVDAENKRVLAGHALARWQAELPALSGSAPDALEAAVASALDHLAVIRDFLNTVVAAVNTSNSLTPAALATFKASAAAALAEVNTAVRSLNAAAEAIASQKLTVAESRAKLDQILAGARKEDVDAEAARVESAKAATEGIEARIRNAEVIAPFSGVVGSVAVKVGQLASPNAPAVMLVPDSPLQAVVSVTEIDVGHIAVGDRAAVTLDAYGAGRVFPAHVAEVDATPSEKNGIAAYAVKLSFDAPDSAVKTGMTANVTITPSR